MSSAWIIDSLRTPIGRHRGQLASVRADDLATTVVAELVRRSSISPASIDDLYLGCTNGVGEDSRNVARMVVLLAGLPHEVPGATINRLCGSGMEAVIAASRAIRCGEAEVIVAGGVESMTRAPWAMLKPERAQPWGDAELVDTTIGWRFVNPRMPASATASMGETAENVAERYGVTREDQDRFAYGSHEKAVHARRAGRFAEEIVPIEVRPPRGESVLVDEDEGPREDIDLQRLAALPPVFREGGTVTAGNSSPINDGAAALLMVGDAGLSTLDRPPLARLLSSASVGVAPEVMGIGPVPAVQAALQRAGLEVGDVGVVELNEAFASQALASIRELGLDPRRVNPNGGAIALGHPLGCSGARIVGTLAREMFRRSERYGLATMCVGVGQGVAVVLENAAYT